MKKYILFDLDGTLTDPMEGICKSAARGLAHFGIKADYHDLTFFIGPPLLDTYRDRYGMNDEQAREAVAAFREYFQPTGIYEHEIYPGIEEMLKELQDKGYFLAMATSKPEAFADIVLRHFHIRDYIKVMAGATMDEGRTNKAEVLAYALEQMNISDLSEAVMVGDRSYDVKGAQAMGIDSVGVLYGYGSREELEEAGATKIAKSVEDLKNILLNWK